MGKNTTILNLLYLFLYNTDMEVSNIKSHFRGSFSILLTIIVSDTNYSLLLKGLKSTNINCCIGKASKNNSC
jgi:hypothetical protein